MPDSPTKLQRWLDLIAYLVERRLPVSVEELMERIPGYAQKWGTGEDTARATARRTFERDKDELRRAGIPIRTVVYNQGFESTEGYRLDRRDFHLPYLRLLREHGPPRGTTAGRHGIARLDISPADLDLAVDALRRVSAIPTFPFAGDARSALRKLTFDLEGHEPAPGAPVLFIDRQENAELRAALRVLSDALLARKRARFRYHGLYRDQETERDVAPWALVFQRGHWYLVGHDATREDVRVFRVDRMRDVTRNTRTPNAPDYAIPADFRVDDHVGRRAWELHGREEPAVSATVQFDFPLSIWAERNACGQPIETRPDGSTVRAFDVHQVAPFVRWVLAFEGEARVVSPAELEDAYRAMAKEIADRHTGPVAGGDDA